jgi:hypothetical protein
MWQIHFMRPALGLGALLLTTAAAFPADHPSPNPYDLKSKPYYNPSAGQANPYTQGPVPITLRVEGTDGTYGLNGKLKELRKLHAQGVAGADMTLPARLLAHLNVRRGEKGAEIGLLRTTGSFPWPAPLREHTAAKDREQFHKLLQAALQADARRAAATEQLAATLEQVRAAFVQQVNVMPTAQYLEGKRFLDRLDTTVRALADATWCADLAMAQELAARCKSVAALVRYLDEKGLQFAPPLPGDEASYQELARLLETYLERSRPHIDPDLRPRHLR